MCLFTHLKFVVLVLQNDIVDTKSLLTFGQCCHTYDVDCTVVVPSVCLGCLDLVKRLFNGIVNCF